MLMLLLRKKNSRSPWHWSSIKQPKYHASVCAGRWAPAGRYGTRTRTRSASTGQELAPGAIICLIEDCSWILIDTQHTINSHAGNRCQHAINRQHSCKISLICTINCQRFCMYVCGNAAQCMQNYESLITAQSRHFITSKSIYPL